MTLQTHTNLGLGQDQSTTNSDFDDTETFEAEIKDLMYVWYLHPKVIEYESGMRCLKSALFLDLAKIKATTRVDSVHTKTVVAEIEELMDIWNLHSKYNIQIC